MQQPSFQFREFHKHCLKFANFSKLHSFPLKQNLLNQLQLGLIKQLLVCIKFFIRRFACQLYIGLALIQRTYLHLLLGKLAIQHLTLDWLIDLIFFLIIHKPLLCKNQLDPLELQLGCLRNWHQIIINYLQGRKLDYHPLH